MPPAQTEKHQKRMMGEVAKLTDGSDGTLDVGRLRAHRRHAAVRRFRPGHHQGAGRRLDHSVVTDKMPFWVNWTGRLQSRPVFDSGRSSKREPAMTNRLGDMIDQGQGKAPADIVLKGGRLFDLTTGDCATAISPSAATASSERWRPIPGIEEIDISGQIVVPGFIDTHLHIESSLVTPHEFDRCVLPRGVTTAICDPHEIANVIGATGIRYFLDCAEQTIMDIRVQLSSCVPATHLETAGARLDIEDLLPFRDHPR
jgi:hypothetical protein